LIQDSWSKVKVAFCHTLAMTSKAFVATSGKGAFQREASKFRNWIERNSSAAFPAGTINSLTKKFTIRYVRLSCAGD
jgi:glutathionyl-hydroquinone reductase